MAEKKTAPVVPELVIDGKKYKPVHLKVRTWYEFVKHEETGGDMGAVEYANETLALIASIFPPEITPEVLMDKVPIEGLRPLYTACLLWVVRSVNGTLGKIPNAEAEAAQ